jgi:RNA polymerase sigma-70 factor (ECF subfamily)
MGDEPGDDELVPRIAAGGEAGRAAEELLCRRFAPRVRLYGLRHLRDADRAAELVQVVLLAVLQAARAGRIDEPARLDRYVLGTCRHAAARLRATDRRTEPAGELDDVIGPPPPAIELGGLVRCITHLDERAREVLVLTFQHDRSADEIAGLLAITAGNVRVVRHRALASLRRCLDGAAP